jgi:hypothetical protein
MPRPAQASLFADTGPAPKRIRESRAHDAANREAARIVLSDPRPAYDCLREWAKMVMEKK